MIIWWPHYLSETSAHNCVCIGHRQLVSEKYFKIRKYAIFDHAVVLFGYALYICI